MIVANVLQKIIQTRTKIEILKPTTLSLLLKIKIEYIKSNNTVASLHVEEKLLSQYQIFTTKKQTKTTLATHKLHSLHPFI